MMQDWADYVYSLGGNVVGIHRANVRG